MRRTAFAIAAIALGCSEPAGSTTPPETPPETPHVEPTPVPEPEPTPEAPPVVADPARAPFDIHVSDGVADPGARAWVDLSVAALGTASEGGYTLRATPRDFYGIALVQLETWADPDGRSGTSWHPSAVVRYRDGAWTFVHAIVEEPPELPIEPVRPATDAHLRIAECDREANAAVLAVPYAERGAAAQRCPSIDAEVSAAFLARAQGRGFEREVVRFLHDVLQLGSPTAGASVAQARSDVPSDVRWLDGGRWAPWHADRQVDSLSASGTLLRGRSWYAFTLRASPEAITLELALLGHENSHGVPP